MYKNSTGIFFDIDGTLRDVYTSSVPKSTAAELKRLRNEGYLLGIASGRAMTELSGEIKGLIDWDAYVCINGHVVHDKDKNIIYEGFFPQEIVDKCLEIANKTNRPLQLVDSDGLLYLNREPDETAAGVYQLLSMDLPVVKPYGGERLRAVMAFGDEEDYTEYRAISGVTVCRGMGFYADIVLNGTSKYSGIKKIMEHYGICEYIAFGDALNDLEMLANAKISVAMGESHEEIIAVADYHTSTVLEDGIMLACKELGI